MAGDKPRGLPRAGSGAPHVVGLTLVLFGGCAAAVPVFAGRHALHPMAPAVAVLIALMFGFSETLLIHVPLRRDTHSITFSEVPLALGLFVLAPLHLVAAALGGSVLALVAYRRQWGVKLIFNIAQVGAQSFVAIAVFIALRDSAALLSVRSYAAAAAAALCADLASASLVTIAISLFRGAWSRGLTPWTLVGGAIASLARTALALLAVAAVVHGDAAGVMFVAICASSMYYAFRAYAGLHERHRRLELLYRFTNAVGGSFELDRIGRAIVEEARELLHAARAELVMVGANGEMVRCTVTADDTFALETVGSGTDDGMWARVVDAPGTVVDGGLVATMLSSPSGPIGYLMVSEPSGIQGGFDAIDVRLFVALARHAAVALDNGRLVKQLEIEARQREHRARHDALTGLANRACFSETLDAELRGGRGVRHVLFVLDLDHFSEINQTLGHDNGDIVLREIAHRLRGVAHHGVVGRLGGDEFAMFVPDSGDTDLAILTARVVRAVTEQLTVDHLDLEIRCTAGIAIAPDHGSTAVALLRHADSAMRAAKSRRSGVEIYEPHEEHTTRRRLFLAHELRHAFDRHEFVVHYQPVIELPAERAVGVEALVRWQHPARGLLVPDVFIPIAEHAGLIDALTVFVLDTAVAQRQDWVASGLELDVSVNISARSLVNWSLHEHVTRALSRHGCPARALTLEITESQLMTDPERAAIALTDLHALGVRISIDDFGTGYSSLTSLRSFPIDEVKIDKSFVIGSTTHHSDSVIVRSIADLGRNLGLRVVAEGVEHEQSLTYVSSCGVQLVQGYHYSKPLPSAELDHWLRTHELVNAPNDAAHDLR